MSHGLSRTTHPQNSFVALHGSASASLRKRIKTSDSRSWEISYCRTAPDGCLDSFTLCGEIDTLFSSMTILRLGRRTTVCQQSQHAGVGSPPYALSISSPLNLGLVGLNASPRFLGSRPTRSITCVIHVFLVSSSFPSFTNAS